MHMFKSAIYNFTCQQTYISYITEMFKNNFITACSFALYGFHIIIAAFYEHLTLNQFWLKLTTAGFMQI